MKRITIAVAFMLCALAPARAASFFADDDGSTVVFVSETGWSMCRNGLCTWGEGSPPNAHIVTVPQPESDDERQAHKAADDKWVAYCNPKIVHDENDVPRYVYAHKGCENGRSE